MSLCIPLVVFDVINVILIATPIHLHRLEKADKVTELGFPIDAHYIMKIESTSLELTQCNDQHVD